MFVLICMTFFSHTILRRVQIERELLAFSRKRQKTCEYSVLATAEQKLSLFVCKIAAAARSPFVLGVYLIHWLLLLP